MITFIMNRGPSFAWFVAAPYGVVPLGRLLPSDPSALPAPCAISTFLTNCSSCRGERLSNCRDT